jgi:hypothetical protein
VSSWGYGLLVVFVGLGLSPISWRKSGRLAAMIALVAMAYAFYSYGAI